MLYRNALVLMRSQIIKDFSKHWELNDPAHRVEHFQKVEELAHWINLQLGSVFSSDAIVLASYFHDLFTWDRSNHHLLSGQWIETTDYPLVARHSGSFRRMVADACREHRASYKGEYSSKFSELMASADRGIPKDVDAQLKRAIDYRLFRGATEAEAREGAVAHLKEKFGRGGYARYPALYLEVFKDQLEIQYSKIDAL